MNPHQILMKKGKDKVYSLLEKEADSSIIIIASNEKSDLEICSSLIQLEQYKIVNNSVSQKGDLAK